MNNQRSFVMLKPGVLQRRAVGDILTRFERKGLRLIAMKMLEIPPAMACAHYAEHAGKDFFEHLVSYITSGPVVAMVFEGDCAVSLIRKICGPAQSLQCECYICGRPSEISSSPGHLFFRSGIV